MSEEHTEPVVEPTGPATEPADTIDERIGDLEPPAAVEDMIPEPPVSGEPEPADPLDSKPSAESPSADVEASDEAPVDPAEPAASTEDVDPAPADPAASADVAGLTAADIPALEGCDVEKSWSGDETCEGTEPIAETPEQAAAIAAADPEADSGLEPAEGEAEASEAIIAHDTAISVTPTWPFIVYLVVWAIICVAAGYALLKTPEGAPLALTDAYRASVLSGVVMTVAGPLLILAVWIASYFRAGDRAKTGMLASALLKGSVVTFLGVVMWWGTFLVVDQLRFGRFV